MSNAGARDPFAAYRARLDALGFRPSRRLGQNFLLEPSLHRVIADAAGLGVGDVALEIGAGLGFLTRELAVRAAHVVTVEVDPRLACVLREDFPAGESRVEIVECDALAADDRLAAPVEAALDSARAAFPGARLVAVANLPYAIAGPLLVALAVLGGTKAVASLAVLVQAELGERITAAPSTKEYGSLSALLSTFFHARIERRVGREVFRPRPQVDSAIVSLRARDGLAPWQTERPGRVAFARFCRALFASRRKTLRFALDRLVPGWTDLGAIDASLASQRAESLAPDELAALFVGLGSPGLERPFLGP